MQNRRVLIGMIVLTTLFGTSEAGAQTGGEQHLLEGVELRKQGKDVEALAAFERAFALSPSPRARAQIALAEQALGQWVLAEAHMQDALAREDGWVRKNNAILKQALAEIQRHLATLEVTSNVGGAEVFVNGELVAKTPTSSLRVVAGTVVLELSARGYTPAQRTLQVLPEGQARETLTLVSLEAAPRPTTPKVSPSASAPTKSAERIPVLSLKAPVSPPRAALSPLAYIAGGVGVAAVGIGSYFGIRTFLKKSERDEHCHNLKCDPDGMTLDSEARSSATISTIGFGVGAASTAAFMWMFFSRKSPNSAADTGVLVIPAVGSSGTGLSASGRF